MKKYITLILLSLLLFSCPVYAAKTTKQKIASSVKRADIVIAGSSSVCRWKKAKTHFSPYKVANLGVGGTIVEDWQKYHSYIAKCKPKVIVIYVGNNNFKTKQDSGALVAKKSIKLLKTISKNNPKAKVYYVSLHPNPKKWAFWKQVQICNNTVKKWCKTNKKVDFIDIRKYCLKNGKPNLNLFCDSIHFNSKGYNNVWNKIVATKVKKYLKKNN